jgi:hypothetical protein
VELEGKRFAMMHAIVPADKAIAALVDSNNPAAERQASDIEEAARSLVGCFVLSEWFGI